MSSESRVERQPRPMQQWVGWAVRVEAERIWARTEKGREIMYIYLNTWTDEVSYVYRSTCLPPSLSALLGILSACFFARLSCDIASL